MFIVLGLLVLFNQPSVEEYEADVIEQEEVKPAWMTDEDAVKAAEDVIHRKALKAELEAVQGEIKALTARQTEIEKELGSYWTVKANILSEIRKTFPEDPDTAIAIAYCESGLKPTAHNPHNRNGTTDGGLWQINSVHDKRLKQLGLNKYDPEDATKFARMLYDERGGWGDWVCHTKGMHLAYIHR